MASSTRANQSAKASRRTARYNASLDGKWCRRLGRRMPTLSAMSFRLVPLYPCSANRSRATSRMRDLVPWLLSIATVVSMPGARVRRDRQGGGDGDS